MYIALIALNFTKAFDTIGHDILLSRLPRLGFSKLSLLPRIGFSKSVINWVASYLLNQLQSVRYAGATFQALPVLPRTPQCSILGSTMFIIYLNSLLQLLPSLCYADDITLVAQGKNSDKAINALQLCINIVLS